MSEAVIIYLKNLINRVFKILPLYEEKSDTLSIYLGNLATEMLGCYELHNELVEKPQFLATVNIIKFLETDKDYDLKVCRRLVFTAIRNIEFLVGRSD